MLPSNSIAGCSSVSRFRSANPEEQDTWFDAIDHVVMEDIWFDACESHQFSLADAGETADSRVPFTEDCRRGVQQLVRTLGEYGESKMLSACLSKILPDTPTSLVIAANSLYTAITEQRNIDAAALHVLGLVSWYLPDNINIVSHLAAFIRNTVTDWMGETFLQQWLGESENQASASLFTALAVTAIVAGRWMKNEGAPQRGLLKVPAFMANIFIRASHYWTALGNMAQSLPSNGKMRENSESSRRVPAFEVDTLVEMTGDACDDSVSCLPSSRQITAFSSNSTTTPGAYTQAIVRNKPASTLRESYQLSVPEQAHSLAVDKLRQESGLLGLLYCTTRKTATCQQTNGEVVTAIHFNTQCDAIAYPEPLMKAAESTLVYTDKSETQVSSAATSHSGGEVLLPLVMTAATVPVATSYLQALKSKSVITAGSTLLAVGGVVLWKRGWSPSESHSAKATSGRQQLKSNKIMKKESVILDCDYINKSDVAGYSDKLYNNFFISNMPHQTEFQILYIQPSNAVMASITGEHPKQYDSIKDLKYSLNDHKGKILTRRIEHALTETEQRIKNAYFRLIDPTEKKDILLYLSVALETDNKIALDQAYERLRRIAFQTSLLVKNHFHSISFFERRDKSKPFPAKMPMVLVNQKNSPLIQINLELVEKKLPQLLAQQSSEGYNPELVDELMRQMIMQTGNTQDLLSLQRCRNEDGISLGMPRQALQNFANEDQQALELMNKWSVYPDDTAVMDILNKMQSAIITNEMRNEAKSKLSNPDDEYYQRKTGKSAPTEDEQKEVRNAITWIYSGSDQDFKVTKFFNDPVYRADRMTANTDSATIYLRDIGLDRNQTTDIEDSLSDNETALEFIQKARELYNKFSDPEKVVKRIARNKVYERTGQDLDPDKIFLHQFTLGQTIKDTNSYTGYAHNGQPLYSETLTQAYMDNFKIFRKRQNSSFINALNKGIASLVGNGYLPPHLDDPELTAPFFTGPNQLTGLYRVNASANHFCAENEVKYLPSDLKNDIYDANVMKQLEGFQNKFWSEYSEEWRAIAKGQFIKEARLALLNNDISQDAYEIVIKGGAANIILYDQVTMDELKEFAAPADAVEVSFLNVLLPSSSYSVLKFGRSGSFYKTNILCFTGKDGREVLYVTGDKHAFREFKNSLELKTWFEQQIKNDDARTAFLQHISLADRKDKLEASLKNLADGKIEDVILKPSIAKKNIKEQFYTDDAFSALTQLTEKRTKNDADILINSNDEVLLQSVQQTLQGVNILVMPLLAMLGPVGIVLDIGLAAAQLFTDVGVAYTADTPEEQSGALIDVGLDLLFLGISSGSALKLPKSSIRNAFPAPPSSGQALLKTDIAILQKHPEFLHRVKVIKENGLSGRGAIKAGKNWRQQAQKPIGDDLNFRWVEDEIGETEQILRTQLFSEGASAAKLREFRDRPTGLCYEAMVESFGFLKNQGEHPKAIGLLIYKNPWDDAPSNHFATFIRRDAADFIVDPTIRQFDPSLPESATVLLLGDWKEVMKSKAGAGKDYVIMLSLFDTPLQARQTVADLHAVKGKYYQSDIIKKDNINILKYGYSFENSIIHELKAKKKELRALASDSASFQDVKQDLERLQALKQSFALLSPQEIKVTRLIDSKTKRLVSKFSVPEEEIPALKSVPDPRDIITSVSGGKYIKIDKKSYVIIQEQSTSQSAWVIYQGQKKVLMNFDDVKQKWMLPDSSATAKGSDPVSLDAVRPIKSEADPLSLPGTSGMAPQKNDPSKLPDTKVVTPIKKDQPSSDSDGSWLFADMMYNRDMLKQILFR